jgi:hypothetical protein
VPVDVLPEPEVTTPPLLNVNDGILTVCAVWLTPATIDPIRMTTNTITLILAPARAPGL